MGKTLKRGFSVFLVLLMVFSSIPLTDSFADLVANFAITASATDATNESESNIDGTEISDNSVSMFAATANIDTPITPNDSSNAYQFGICEYFTGIYDGKESNGTVIRRNYLLRIVKIYDDGTFYGIGHVLPREESGSIHYGSYYLKGSIDSNTKELTWQGYEWIEKIDNFDFINFYNGVISNSNDELVGKTEHGEFILHSVDNEEYNTIRNNGVNKQNIQISVKAYDKNGNLKPIAGADIFLYLGQERIDKFSSDSNGKYMINLVSVTKNGRYSVDNLSLSAEFQNSEYILYSENTTDAKVSLSTIFSNKSYEFILDKYCKKYNISVAYLKDYKDQSLALIEDFRNSFWTMTGGRAVIGEIELREQWNYADLCCSTADIRITNVEKSVRATVDGFINGGHIYMGLDTKSQDIGTGNMLAHEAGHYFFGFRDEYCTGFQYEYDLNGNGKIDKKDYIIFYTESSNIPKKAKEFSINLTLGLDSSRFAINNLNECSEYINNNSYNDDGTVLKEYKYGDRNQDGNIDGKYYYLPFAKDDPDKPDEYSESYSKACQEINNLTANDGGALYPDRPIIHEENGGYWSTKDDGSYSNGFFRRPNAFGVMDNHDKLQLSNSNSYSYLGDEFKEVNKNYPGLYTNQYFINGKSCEEQFTERLNGNISACPYGVVAHAATSSDQYYSNMNIPESKITYTQSEENVEVLGNSEIYNSSIETDKELVQVSSKINNNIIEFTVNSDNDQTWLFMETKENSGTINEENLEFADGKACFEFEHSIGDKYVLTFIQESEDGKYYKNTYTISNFDSEISDNTLYSQLANVSIEQTNEIKTDEELLILKNDCLYTNGNFKSIDGSITLIKKDSDSEINSDLIKTVSLNSGLNLETIGAFKYENGTYTRISQGYSEGEKQLAYVSFPYDGEGTYMVMAEPASTEQVNSVANLSVTESTELSGTYTISFEDSNNDASELVGYNIYYSMNPIVELNSENVCCITVSPYSKSYNINLKDNYGTWYFAVETLAKNGSKSSLSEVVEVSFDPLDSDNDGIPDYWIDKYNLNALANVAKVDSDDDGLNNLDEYKNGTNPLNPDTDGDNVYDYHEVSNNLNPLSVSTDGVNDDYIVCYGTPDVKINTESMYINGENVFCELSNIGEGAAMHTTIALYVDDLLTDTWSVNLGKGAVASFEIPLTYFQQTNQNLKIVVDEERITRDLNYNNNTYTYSHPKSVNFDKDSYNLVKNSEVKLSPALYPENEASLLVWSVEGSEKITVDNRGIVSASGIGKGRITVTSINGVSSFCEIYSVAFEGAEYSEFDSKLVNNNAEVAVIGYIGDDTSIAIPETIGSLPVTQLDSNAFKGCSFKEVTIHSGINSIANNTFSDTMSLESIIVDETNTSYRSVNGILYSSDKTQLVKYPSAKTDTIFEIPEMVTSIGDYSVNKCNYIEEIDIPESVTSIGKYGISNCNNLKTVKYNAVSCSAPMAFLGLNAAFSGSNSIEKVIVGDNVTVIPQYLFFGKNNLTEVVITEKSKLSTIAQCSFYNCSKLANIFIPETVRTIGSSAFYGCSKLNDVVLPESLTTIGSSAFSGCSSLTSINIPETVITINSSTFYGCNKLNGIELPETLTSIGSSAFSGCSSLTSIKIPKTVTSISDNTFANCTALEKIEIPYQITTIGETPFKGCSKLVVWCYNNSVAYEYAKANSIKYKIMELDADDLVVTGIQETFIDSLQYQLSAEIAPIYTDEKIVWSSSDSNVFTVSNSGLITAKGAGEAILTVASSRGSVSKTFNINVLGLSKDSENANLYYVRNADDMLTLSTMVNNGVSFAGKIIKLDNDVDLSNVAWTPIGIDSTYVFSGVFDGNNHKISGLNYATTSNTYSGLFGYIKTGGIKDLTVEGSVSGISRVGMIAGCIFDSALYNCKVIGEVKRIGSGSYGYVGGLAGSALHSVIINCAAETNITTDFGDSSINYAAVGGIVGAASTAGSDPMCILNSYCIGDISVSGNSYSYENYYVGGIAGYLKDDAANNYYFGEITNADEDPIKKIGYAFGYVIPEYTSESNYNGIGTIIVQDNYYLEGKNAIGLISEGDYDSSNWVSPISEENFSKLIGKGSLVDELNGNKGSVEDIIVAHRDILSNSTWAELVDRINGDSFTVSSWKIGANNLPVNYECDCYRHAESEWVIDVEANCTKEGSKHTYCLVCQETVTTSIIEKAEHKFSDWTETKAATCTEKGSEYRTCTTCNSATETRDIAKLGHNFVGEWTTDKAPTCTKSGVESRICTRCKSEKETRTVDELGHDFESNWTVDKEATCSKVGSKSHHCSRCDEKSDVTVINKIAHSYRESVQEATCTKDGKKTYNCSACGDSYSEVVTTKGHIDQNGDGKCDNCDYIYDNTCDHMCHKSGFMGFIWKIVRFFWKLFKMNPICECGVAHY